MANISKKISSMRLQKLYNQKDENLDLLVVNKSMLVEKSERKYQSAYKKEIRKLQPLQLECADIEQETKGRMAAAMRRFNTKDYWLRREAIQTWRRTRDEDENAFQKLEAHLHELDEKKYAKEEAVRTRIHKKLEGKIVMDEGVRDEKRKLYQAEKEKSDKLLAEYRAKLESETAQKLQVLEDKAKRLDQQYEAKINKLEAGIKADTNAVHMDEDVLLKLEHLSMHFGGLKAVDDLSFEVKKGEIFGLIGPNGAGKTTVFNCITQFYKPTHGKLYFKDRTNETILLNDYAVHDVIKHGIVRTFQNVELIKEVSVMDNLLIGAHTQYHSSLIAQFLHLPILKKEEIAIRKKAEDVLEFMGLSLYKDWLVWGLPYGVLKKIEIARTLMNSPQLIILDEPAAGLNDSETAELAKIIRKIKEKYNCTILLVEHDMGLVMDICDTVCAISFGKMLGIGTTEEIQSNPKVQEAYLGSSEDEV